VSLTTVLAVHGGAGRLPANKVSYPGRRPYELALARALRCGQSVLLKGGSAVRAVTEAVAVLEDEPLLNAGRGAVLCADGSIELCAAVMGGRRQQFGAVAGLTRTRNPVRAARELLEHRHGLLFGAAGDAFAEGAGLEMVSPEFFLTPLRQGQWKRLHGTSRVELDHSGDEATHGTVGAVARDRRGHLAAATSTGGLVNQLPGRIGDTPIAGAGTWADGSCAVSATGKGEAFARVAFARRVADLIGLVGAEPAEAARRALEEVARFRGQGGCIVVDSAGRLALPFSSAQMLRGWVVGPSRPKVAILADEEIETV